MAKTCGLIVDGKHLELGDEVPRGALSAEALRCEYEPPLRRIELLDFALQDSELRAICLARGSVSISFDAGFSDASDPTGKAPIYSASYLDSLTRSKLEHLCLKHDLNWHGRKELLRDRLLTVVG